VVVAIEDPDPRVRGEGIARLRAAGIDVEVGPGADAVTKVLAPYLHHRRTGRASCLVKTAASIDGRVAAADGSSRWITGEAARADAHELRADSQAVVVGAGTALADRPSLTVRLAADPDADRAERQPLRVLLDSRGRVPAEGPLFDTALAPTLALTTTAAPHAVIDAWQAAGAKVEVVEPASEGSGVDLTAVLALLGRDGVLQAMVEGGPTLHGALLREGLVDRIVAYVAGAALGAGGRPVFDGPSPAGLADAPRFELLDARVLAGDVRLEYSGPHSDTHPNRHLSGSA
jgi:diaminohydroxyphosphoribosylaminopyrimidine deaminase/5-amino-6-(5-phosphoribosylamino)uracil reductase